MIVLWIFSLKINMFHYHKTRSPYSSPESIMCCSAGRKYESFRVRAIEVLLFITFHIIAIIFISTAMVKMFWKGWGVK